EAPWAPDQCGQDVRCQRVDGEQMRQPVFGRDAPGFLIPHGRIVNYPIEGAEPIDLIGHAPSLGDTRQIADDNRLRSGDGGQRFLSPPPVAGVQNDLVALPDEELGGHSTEPIRRTCDEHTRHNSPPPSATVTMRETSLVVLIASATRLPSGLVL